MASDQDRKTSKAFDARRATVFKMCSAIAARFDVDIQLKMEGMDSTNYVFTTVEGEMATIEELVRHPVGRS